MARHIAGRQLVQVKEDPRTLAGAGLNMDALGPVADRRLHGLIKLVVHGTQWHPVRLGRNHRLLPRHVGQLFRAQHVRHRHGVTAGDLRIGQHLGDQCVTHLRHPPRLAADYAAGRADGKNGAKDLRLPVFRRDGGKGNANRSSRRGAAHRVIGKAKRLRDARAVQCGGRTSGDRRQPRGLADTPQGAVRRGKESVVGTAVAFGDRRAAQPRRRIRA